MLIQQVKYQGRPWTVTRERGNYLTIERGAESKTVHRSVTGPVEEVVKKVERPEPEVCRRCLHRHRSYEWCRHD